MSDNALTKSVIDLDSMTPEQALQVEARILGMKRMPVSIEQFIEDPYYLGNVWGNGKLYPYWKEKLQELYPDPLHVASTFVILTGPIGGGKTTLTDIAALYTLHKLDCLANYNYFGIQINKGIDFLFFHLSAQNAWDLQVSPIYTMMEGSPYFSQDFQGLGYQYFLRGEGLRTDKSTGHDVLFYAFSEVNFNSYEATKFRIDQSISRLKSRFIKILNYFGNIFIDSSAASEGSLVEDLIREYPVMMKVFRDPIWVIKASTGAYFRHPDENGNLSFKVFTGDGTHDPMIIDELHPLPEDCDPDKIIDVPNELLDEFRSNLELALQNNAGIGTAISDQFLKDKVSLKVSFCIPNHIQEVVLVDFFDEESLFDLIRAQLKEVPEDKILCIGVDMGVSGDLCGFACSYFDDWIRDSNQKPTREFKTCTPIALGISRKPEQETRISKVFKLILEINEVREVGLVVTDGYQSTQLRQDLTAAGIWCYLSSVDRTKDGYLFYKLQVYKGYQRTVKHKRLQTSQENLHDYGYKVDHDEENEKDISDAQVNSLWNISLQPEFFAQVSKIGYTKRITETLEQMRTPQDEINEFLNQRRF